MNIERGGFLEKKIGAMSLQRKLFVLVVRKEVGDEEKEQHGKISARTQAVCGQNLQCTGRGQQVHWQPATGHVERSFGGRVVDVGKGVSGVQRSFTTSMDLVDSQGSWTGE